MAKPFVVPPNLPAFGSPIPGQGGRLAAIMPGEMVGGVQQPPYALLISNDASNEKKLAWNDVHILNPRGARSRTDGLANTRDMLAMGCAAALYIRQHPLDGFDDWYLPSVEEIQAAAAHVKKLFGSPDRDAYWTSTRSSRTEAHIHHLFMDREITFEVECNSFFVRHFRRIPLDLLTPMDG